MLAGPCPHIVDIGSNHSGQHPANVDSHHWFLETLLRHQRANGLDRCRKSFRLFLCTMGWRKTSPLQCSWRKRVLGRLLLWRPKTVNIPHKGNRLGSADHFHMGRVCVHVCWCPDGHTTPCQAQKAVETSSRRSIRQARACR